MCTCTLNILSLEETVRRPFYLGNISLQNEMLQKTAEMYEQDKKELRYEVWKTYWPLSQTGKTCRKWGHVLDSNTWESLVVIIALLLVMRSLGRRNSQNSYKSTLVRMKRFWVIFSGYFIYQFCWLSYPDFLFPFLAGWSEEKSW